MPSQQRDGLGVAAQTDQPCQRMVLPEGSRIEFGVHRQPVAQRLDAEGDDGVGPREVMVVAAVDDALVEEPVLRQVGGGIVVAKGHAHVAGDGCERLSEACRIFRHGEARAEISSTSRNSLSLCASQAPMRKTKVPRCGRTSTRPSLLSSRKASRTGVLLADAQLGRKCALGASAFPGPRSPLTIRSRIWSAACSARDGGSRKCLLARRYSPLRDARVQYTKGQASTPPKRRRRQHREEYEY